MTEDDGGIRPLGDAADLLLHRAIPGGQVVDNDGLRGGERFGRPLAQREKRLIGSLYGSANTPVDIPKLVDLFKTGRLPLHKLLGERYELSAINEAYAALSRGVTGRAVIIPDGAASGRPRARRD
ncbi:hypothetical protein [Streptomyces sp. DSM 41534]